MSDILEESKENEQGDSGENGDSEPRHDLALLSEIQSLEEPIKLKDGFISTRMFLMGNGTTMMALVLSETDDAYIVALPALMATTTGGVKVEFISPLPVTKVYKHSMSMLMLPYTKYLYAYFKSLQSQELNSKLPGYFNAARMTQLTLFIKVLEQTLQSSFTGKTETSPLKKPTGAGMVKTLTLDEEGYDVDGVGMTDFFTDHSQGPGRKRTTKH